MFIFSFDIYYKTSHFRVAMEIIKVLPNYILLKLNPESNEVFCNQMRCLRYSARADMKDYNLNICLHCGIKRTPI